MQWQIVWDHQFSLQSCRKRAVRAVQHFQSWDDFDVKNQRTSLLVVTFAILKSRKLDRSAMALRDWIWPCEIEYGLAISNMALRDPIWPCKIQFGLVIWNMALRDQTWPCEIKYSLARSNLALRYRIWSCEIKYGLARSNMALRHRIWPCEKAHGFSRRSWKILQPCK